MDPAPLSELRQHLSSGDLDAARDLLYREPWTNLANVLRVLPEHEKRVAFGLLDPAMAARLRSRLTTEERRELDSAPDMDGPQS